MPQRLLEPHSCSHCQHLVFDTQRRKDSGPSQQTLDEWEKFASKKAIETLVGTPGLPDHLTQQLSIFNFLCTVSQRQVKEYAAEGCLMFEYVCKHVAIVARQPRDNYQKFSSLLNYTGEQPSDDETHFLIGIEYTKPSEFCFRYFARPYREFHVAHFIREDSEFTSEDWAKFDPFRVMLESKQPDLPWIPSAINYEPGSQATLSSIKHEYDRNQSVSKDESRKDAHFVPTRLLKLDQLDYSSGVHLIQTRAEEHTDIASSSTLSFAALSYCWGGDQKLKLTKANKEILMAGIQLEDLPRTIRDALTVTTEMGVSHLWIDALCIVQDDDDDKGRELGMMAKVYENAAFTIVAARAASVEDGFLAPRLPFKDGSGTPFRLRMRATPDASQRESQTVQEPETYSVVCFPAMDIINPKEIDSITDPVHTRGWCFQETTLSKCIIEFGNLRTCLRYVHPGPEGKPVFDKWIDGWRPQMAGEHDNSLSQMALAVMENQETKLLDLWERVVMTYSRLSVSFPEDRLPALSAVAQTFGIYLGGSQNYLAGIWHHELPVALLWILETAGRDNSTPTLPQQHAPTWSWASSMSAMQTLPTYTRLASNVFETDQGIKFINCKINLTQPAVPFGAVSRGELHLLGRLRPARLYLRDPSIVPKGAFTESVSMVDGTSFSEYPLHSMRVDKLNGEDTLATERGLHRLGSTHPKPAYRDVILSSLIFLDHGEAATEAAMERSEGLYMLPVASGPSEERKLHVDEMAWGFRMPRMRSVFGLVLTKNNDGTFSRIGVFHFADKYCANLLDNWALDIEECVEVLEDQYKWLNDGEVEEVTII